MPRTVFDRGADTGYGPGLEPVVAGAVTVPETEEPPTRLALILVAGVMADTETGFAVDKLVWPRKYWSA